MFWDKKEKKNPQPPQELYQNKKYVQDYDWIDYYRTNQRKGGYGWGEAPNRSSRKRTYFRIVAVLSILAVLFAVKQLDHPVGEDVRLGLRYMLTTDWNVKPAMEKAVKLGLQMAGVDTPIDSGMPQPGMLKETMGKSSIAGNLPVPVSGKVIREYGWNPDPMDGMDRFHPGIDIAASQGSPVKAPLAGKVVKVGTSGQYGRYVFIDHHDGIFTLYAGIGNIKVSEGQTVKADQVIADIGSGGDVNGGGLHFELRENGSLLDPLTKIDIPSIRGSTSESR